MKAGESGPTRTDPPLTVQEFVIYQGASGDFNPMHFDTERALAGGHRGPFAVGMLSASRLASWLCGWVGTAQVVRFSAQFREQAWPGDELTYAGSVVQVEGDTAEVAMTVTRAGGGTHIKATATVLIPAAGTSP